MNNLFSIVSPSTFHLVLRSLQMDYLNNSKSPDTSFFLNLLLEGGKGEREGGGVVKITFHGK